MDSKTELYKEFKEAVSNIKANINDFVNEYILKDLPDSEILHIIKKDGKLNFSPNSLRREPILIQTIKILTMLEISKNIEEFNLIYNKAKAKKKPKEPTGFDKVLKGIMKVPKPKDEKK